MKFRTIFVLSGCFGVLSQLALGQPADNKFKPAYFPADQSALVGLIEFPAYDEPALVRVFCDTNLSRSGNISRSICWSEHANPEPFIKAVSKLDHRMKISPAFVDGKATDIWFQYTVQFEIAAEGKTIKLFPHQFFGIEGSGETYVGPQRYINPRIPTGTLAMCTGKYYLWYAMVIPAEGGKPLNVRALNESKNQNCERYIRGVVEHGRYIPAFLNGEPVTAPYREAWMDNIDP